MLFRSALIGALLALSLPVAVRAEDPAVSYYKDMRPIFQQHCNGCHQPAKPQGGFVMTGHADLLKAGERGKPGVVAGKPAASYLVEQIKLHDNGKAEMPKGRDPLSRHSGQADQRLDRSGGEGRHARQREGRRGRCRKPAEVLGPAGGHRSSRSRPMAEFLAVTGYHEVLLYDTEKYRLQSRLIGISERVQSIAFSPDGEEARCGRRVRPAGSVRCRSGTSRRRNSLVSAPVTFDTLYGVSWSPDGKLIAFGCADNTVRAIDALTGKQVLQMGTHSDWVLGTAFSQDGVHLVSRQPRHEHEATEVATQRFIDNVTSITPGALKGGLMAVDRRPSMEEFLTFRLFGAPTEDGEASGCRRCRPIQPVFRPEGVRRSDRCRGRRQAAALQDAPREEARDRRRLEQGPRIRGDAGPRFGGRVQPGWIKFAAVSSLDGKGEVRVYDTNTGAKVVCEKVTGPPTRSLGTRTAS